MAQSDNAGGVVGGTFDATQLGNFVRSAADRVDELDDWKMPRITRLTPLPAHCERCAVHHGDAEAEAGEAGG